MHHHAMPPPLSSSIDPAQLPPTITVYSEIPSSTPLQTLTCIALLRDTIDAPPPSLPLPSIATLLSSRNPPPPLSALSLIPAGQFMHHPIAAANSFLLQPNPNGSFTLVPQPYSHYDGNSFTTALVPLGLPLLTSHGSDITSLTDQYLPILNHGCKPNLSSIIHGAPLS